MATKRTAAARSHGALIYETADGYISVAVQSDKEWAAFSRAVGRPELLGDPRFKTVALRQQNINDRLAVTQESLAGWSSVECLARLEAEDVPCAPVLRRRDVHRHPQIVESGTVAETDHPQAGRIRHLLGAGSERARHFRTVGFCGVHRRLRNRFGIRQSYRGARRAAGSVKGHGVARKPKKPIEVKTLVHDEAARRNIPTAEYHPVLSDEDKAPIRVAYERRNRDLDPQLVWRGKDQQDESNLIVQAPPLYIQEKVHPKVLVDALLRQSKERREEESPPAPDLFADFNGLPDEEAKTEFYRHDANWSNRMILGDSLQVMASLAEREGLRGKVQCIYIDPPYGIRFNSNFQWSTTSRDVKDGKAEHITREPEQVKAFRDTWRDGIHSYLTYLRDRLTVARDLLTDRGSVFVQIGDENVHRVRVLMDEVFGNDNDIALISFRKTSSASAELLAGVSDYLLWYAKDRRQIKYRQPYQKKTVGGLGGGQYRFVEQDDGRRRNLSDSEHLRPSSIRARVFRHDNMTSQRPPGDFPINIYGKAVTPNRGYWKTGETGVSRLLRKPARSSRKNTNLYPVH